MISFSYKLTEGTELDEASLRFMVTYSVIRCTDIPAVDNAQPVASASPYYLSNSTVHYQCLNGYQHKDKAFITCQRNETWTSDVNCIPVPWCVDDPVTVTNSNRTVVAVKRTIEYTCKEGYESPDGTDSVLVYCSTPDNDTIPWTWNDTNIADTFKCTPVQCNVTELTALANVTVTTARGTVDYMDTVDFECDEGFTKLTGDVKCWSDQTWSEYHLCEEAVPQYLTTAENTKGVPQQVVIVGSVLGVVCILLIFGLIFFVIRSRNLTLENKRLTASGKTQQLVAERSVTNGRINNPTKYEEVGLDLSQENPAVDSENSNQVNNEANTYENSGTRIAGNIQSKGAEYEMVKQGGVGEANHVYTPLNN